MAASLIQSVAAGVIGDDGLPLDTGKVYVYEIGTTTPVTIYADIDLTDPLPNPVTLSAAGKAEIYVNESVRVIVRDSLGVLIDDYDVQNDFAGIGDDPIGQDLIPDVDNTYSLGLTSKRWKQAYIKSIYSTLLETTILGAAVPGLTSNLALSLSAGVLSVCGADGSSISLSNPGYICMKGTTGGLLKLLKVTSGGVLNDDSSASSDMTNQGWGITESADWAEDMPFFLYVVNRNNADIDGTDGNSFFFVARNPVLSSTPSSANNIHDTSTLSGAADTQNDIMILGTVTRANYASLPCQLIGAFRMQWSTTTDDWTIQTLGNTDGIGEEALRATFAKTWTMPSLQNGATSGYFRSSGGTIPVFSTNAYSYMISKDGLVTIDASCSGDGGTDGSGANGLWLILPYRHDRSSLGSYWMGVGYFQAAGLYSGAISTAELYTAAGSTRYELSLTAQVVENPSGTFLSGITAFNSYFTNGARNFEVTARYYPFST